MFDDLPRRHRQSIKKYLHSVEQAMRNGGADEDEVSIVRQSLIEQIGDACKQADPGLSIETVLRSIDAPESFSESFNAAEATFDQQQDSTTRWLGFPSLALAVGVVLVTFGILPLLGKTIEDNAAAFFLFGEVSAIAMATVSRNTPAGKAGLILSGICISMFLMIAVLKLSG